MKEKRISLRFRVSNQAEINAWELLEKVAKERSVSKNALIMELLYKSLSSEDSKEVLAERIAELVVIRLQEAETTRVERTEKEERTANRSQNESEDLQATDEPEVLGEGAIDFLTLFG